MPDHAPAPAGRRIALIAHDNKKRDMLEWAEYNLDLLAGHPASGQGRPHQAALTVARASLGRPRPWSRPRGTSPDDQDRAVGQVDYLVRRAAENETRQVTAAA